MSLSERAFGAVLRLFPREFRARFADDMRDVFHDQVRAGRARAGWPGVVRVWAATSVALLRAALLAHRDAARDRIYPTSHPTDRARNRTMLESSRNDMRFALRMLRKSPVFTVVAVLAISLGAGAVTTIFSAMNALALRPLAGAADGSRVVGLELLFRDGHSEVSGTFGMYERLRADARTLNGVAASARATFTVAAGDEGAVVTANFASANYFPVLGLRPALGRFFLPHEDRVPLANPVVVVSHAFWSTRLAADSTVVGRAITVNGNPYTLIGVAPAGFRGTISLLSVDAWAPFTMQAQLSPGRNLATARWLRMFGRLRDGADVDAAQAELSGLAAAHATTDPAATTAARRATGVRVSMLRAIPEDARDDFLTFMVLLLGAASLVLLIASVNVASLLSARAIARRREMAVRAALGAGRARLIAQLLTEVLVLFVLGAAGGVAIAYAATHAATTVSLPTDVIVAPDMTPDLRVMAFALSVSLVTGLVFGLAPALRASRDDIAARLRDGTAGAGSRRGLVANSMIVGQLALSLVLLVSAGLFLRALNVGARVDTGFDRTGLSIASFESQSWGYDSIRAKRFYAELGERVATIPGVTDVAFASFAPLTTRSMNDSITIRGDERAFTWTTNVGGDYFAALRMPVVSGRALSDADDERATPVAVINETLARRIAPGGAALGKTFVHRKRPVTVVGIARDAKYATFAEKTPPMAFFSVRQFWQPHQTILIRTSAPAAQIPAGVRSAIHAFDRTLPVPALVTLEHASGIAVITQRVAAIVTGTLGGAGLLLASLGLYGIIAYSVGRRTREMGVRVALGARPADVQRLVVREGMRLSLAGVFVGLVLSGAATRLLAGFLFDVSALDTVTFGGMSVLFVAVALVATYLPARRASRADPMVALRAE